MRYHERIDAARLPVTLAARTSSDGSADEGFAMAARAVGCEACLAAATKAHVASLVVDRLWRECPECRDRLSVDHETRRLHVEGLIGALSDAAQRFPPGFNWCAIEGASVLLGTGMPTAAYCSNDLDLLVEAGGLAEIHTVLTSIGFHATDRRGQRTLRVEYRRVMEQGTQWLEVGEAVFDRRWVPLSFEADPREWLDRRVPSPRWPSLFTLEPTDALVVATVHASMHSYVRAPGIRLYAEIDRIIHDLSIDWEAFVYRVRAVGASTRVYVSLMVAEGLVGTPIPTSVLDALAPPDAVRQRLLALVSRIGVLGVTGRRLGPVRTIQLDRLLDDRKTVDWLAAVVLPDAQWLRRHFEDGRTRQAESLALLHLRRVLRLLAHWRPQ